MPRKAKAKSAVRLPLALGGLALLAMTALRPAPSSWSLLRAGRRISTAVDVERDENGKALPLGISSAVADRVRHLGEPIYADEANIFAFDETDSRPIMNTFFHVITNGHNKNWDHFKKWDAEVLGVWKAAWSAAGWNPRVLNLSHAEAFPQYEEILAQINRIPLGNNKEYDFLCYLRHFAMVSVGGGWMTDYDTIPVHINPEVYGNPASLPHGGKWTTYEKHVPSLISGSAEEWERGALALVKEGLEAQENGSEGNYNPVPNSPNPNLFSDMLALLALLQREGEVVNEGISVVEPKEEISMMGKIDLPRDWCSSWKDTMAAHISHASLGSFSVRDRALVMGELLQRFSETCGGPSFVLGAPSSVDESPVQIAQIVDFSDGDQGLDEGRSDVYGSEVHILELGVSYGGGIRVESEELSAVTTTLAVPPACKDRIVSACNKEMLKTLTEAPPSPNAIVLDETLRQVPEPKDFLEGLKSRYPEAIFVYVDSDSGRPTPDPLQFALQAVQAQIFAWPAWFQDGEMKVSMERTIAGLAHSHKCVVECQRSSSLLNDYAGMEKCENNCYSAMQ